MPNWYGIEGIKFEWIGTQSDPQLRYKGYTFSEPDILNGLWDTYREVMDDFTRWEEFVIANAIAYLEDIIATIDTENK